MNALSEAIAARPASAWLVLVCLPVALWCAAIQLRMYLTGPKDVPKAKDRR